MTHLNDDEIQSYIHSGRSDNQAHLKEHLSECLDCQKQLRLYEKLGEMVLSATSNPTPDGFEKNVMGRLKDIRRQNRMTDLVAMTVTVVGLALVGLMVFLTPQVKHIITKALMDIWRYGCELTTGTDGSSDAIAVLAFGATLLVLFAAIDRLIVGRLRHFRELSGLHR